MKVVTGKVRFSYLNAFTPKAINEGDEPKFSVSLLIPKSDKETIGKIKKAIKDALEEGKAKFNGKVPTVFKNPLRDGDEEKPDDEIYEGMMFMNANNSRQPGIVDENREAILDQNEIYSGCYGRAHVELYAFNVNGNKGVACSLQNLQKLEDGERLGAAIESAESAFGDEDSDNLL